MRSFLLARLPMLFVFLFHVTSLPPSGARAAAAAVAATAVAATAAAAAGNNRFAAPRV